MDWNWNKDSKERFNPMDDAEDKCVDIAVLQAVMSMCSFVTGRTGSGRMRGEEFARILRVAADSIERDE